jgi:hypothetical protein
MIRRVHGKAEFAAGDDVGSMIFVGTLQHDRFAVDDGLDARVSRERAKPVGGLAKIDSERPSLTKGRDRSHEH